MTQHQITGLGPVKPDGTMFIFTVRPQPFIASAAWLVEQSKAPAVGDVLEYSDKGAVTLVTPAQGDLDAGAAEPDAADAQKKSAGTEDSANGSEHSLFSIYRGTPFVVHASKITAVGEPEADGSRVITLTGGGTKIAAPDMMSRMVPVEGDYWVIVPQDDGFYEYLNPKAVFEAKYELLLDVVHSGAHNED